MVDCWVGVLLWTSFASRWPLHDVAITNIVWYMA